MWELTAREAIRDLVPRYNSNGDTGRISHVLELFADDAVMEVPGDDGSPRVYRGHDEIATIFTGARDRWAATNSTRQAPGYIRHSVSTHQIDLIDEDHASWRAYFQVVMSHGLDHWGRYFDDYEQRHGRWLFTRRRVTTEGRSANSIT